MMLIRKMSREEQMHRPNILNLPTKLILLEGGTRIIIVKLLKPPNYMVNIKQSSE